MITFLELKNKILITNEDLVVLEEFINPETDLHLLTLLRIACYAGLNIENVDKSKFLNASVNDLKIERSCEVVSEGTQFFNISLDPILKEGNSFTYKDFFDAFGLNYQINAINLIMDIEMSVSEDLNFDYEYSSKDLLLDLMNIRTFDELLLHFNNNQKVR